MLRLVCETHDESKDLILVVYDWFERETESKYKLELTREQYNQMKSLVRPEGSSSDQWVRFSLFIVYLFRSIVI